MSSIFVILSKNPVFSVLFLIFTFTNVACVLFIFNFEFLPISFIVIYVGAIAVLFLFVLIMLNVKLAELSENRSYFLPFAIIFGICFFVELLFLFRFEFIFVKIFHNSFADVFLSDFLNVFAINASFVNLCRLFSNMQIVAFALFNDYLFCFILSGLVLLLAMVGTIALTLKKN